MRYIGKVSGSVQQTNAGPVDQTKLTKPKNKKGKQRLPETPSLIEKYMFKFENNLKKNKTYSFRLSVALTSRELKLPDNVKMLHLVDMFSQENLDIWNKSPGLPWLDIGYKINGDIQKDPESIRKVRHFWHQIKLKDDLRPPDCLVHVPFDLADTEEMGVGVVWEYPATMSFGEAVFAIPLKNAYQESKIFSYGNEEALGGIEKVADRFRSYGCYAKLEFKDFNETVPAWLIKIAFAILTLNVDFCHWASYGIPNAQYMYRMWEYIMDYFINTTIRTTDGMIFKKNSGIPSDSLFTQLIASIINVILCQWICIDQTGTTATDILVRGNKSLIATNTILRPYNANNLLDSIGMHINKEKSQITKDFETLKFPFTE